MDALGGSTNRRNDDCLTNHKEEIYTMIAQEQRNCFKAGLIVINIVIGILGIGLILVGWILQFRTELLRGYMEPLVQEIPSGGGTGADLWTLYNSTAVTFIITGSVVIGIGILGCISGMDPSKKALIAYMVLTTVIIFSQLTSAVLLLTMDVDRDLKKVLRENLVFHYAGDDATDGISTAWNYVFVEFQCCGADSHSDFLITYNWDKERNDTGEAYAAEVPVTCCKLPGAYPNYGKPADANCTFTPTVANANIDQECYSKVRQYLWFYGSLMMACSGVITIFEMMALVAVVMVSLQFKKSVQRNKPNKYNPLT